MDNYSVMNGGMPQSYVPQGYMSQGYVPQCSLQDNMVHPLVEYNTPQQLTEQYQKAEYCLNNFNHSFLSLSLFFMLI